VSRDIWQRIEPTFGRPAASPSDDAADVVFERSTGKTLGLVLIGIALSGLCAAIALGLISRSTPGIFDALAGYVGTVLFPLGTIVWAARLFQPRDVLRVGRAGILDRRISPQRIPWTAISEMSTRKLYSHESLWLHLRPEAAGLLRPPFATRLMRVLNFAGLANVWGISMTGLNGSFEDLLTAVRAASR
jgi:hypothetical protein